MADDSVEERMRKLPVCSYSADSDEEGSYRWEDFTWLAEKRDRATKPVPRNLYADDVNVRLWSWGSDCLQLGLVASREHNCWDLIYRREEAFGLFAWLSKFSNSLGEKLAETPSADGCG